MVTPNDEAARLLASMGYDTAWYSPSPGVEPVNYDISSLAPNYNDAEAFQYSPPEQIYKAQPIIQQPQITAPQAPLGSEVNWLGDAWDKVEDFMKGWAGSASDSLSDPFGPVDDFFKLPGNIFGGVTGTMGSITAMLPMLLLMGGKIDMKKILLLLMMGGLGGALGGLGGIFGGSNTSNQLVSSHTAGGIDPMMMMLLMGNGGGSSNKLMMTMMMAPMLGIDPMSAMMLGQFTNTSSGGRRSYRRRGYSAASRRSYSAGLNAGRTQGFIRSA